MQPSTDQNRRPLAVRELSISKRFARYLSAKNITPNQISLLSILFAFLGLLCAIAYWHYSSPWYLLLVALMIQMRLLCNLFDGMVAIEGGKETPAGELFNDVPDRIADPLLIMAGGFIGHSIYAFDLAWACALVAVLTAYIRVLGVSMNCPADFQGPMAKQHRMALLTIVCVFLFIVETINFYPPLRYSMDAALMVMFIGALVTCWRRLRTIFVYKETNKG